MRQVPVSLRIACARRNPVAIRDALDELEYAEELDLESVYQDSLMGPVLRSPELEAVRKFYPDPADLTK